MNLLMSRLPFRRSALLAGVLLATVELTAAPIPKLYSTGVKDDGTLELVPVTPGRTLGDSLEITGGAVKPGERLVLAPDAKLQAGAKVTVAGR